MVIARVRDITKVGTVIDAVVAAGGDSTRINSIGFSVENPSTYNSQVRDLAMQDAKAKADQIAKISGVTLGKPTFVSDNSNTPIISAPQSYPSAAVGSGAVPPTAISAGQIDITLSVQVSYAIQ